MLQPSHSSSASGSRAYLGGHAEAEADAVEQHQVRAMRVRGEQPDSWRRRGHEASPRQQVPHRQRRAAADAVGEEAPECQQPGPNLGTHDRVCDRGSSERQS